MRQALSLSKFIEDGEIKHKRSSTLNKSRMEPRFYPMQFGLRTAVPQEENLGLTGLSLFMDLILLPFYFLEICLVTYWVQSTRLMFSSMPPSINAKLMVKANSNLILPRTTYVFLSTLLHSLTCFPILQMRKMILSLQGWSEADIFP